MKDTFPLYIAGDQIARETFTGGSLFYPGERYEIGKARSLDIAQAIGLARAVRRPGLPERLELLRRAASAFTYGPNDLERAVRQTGMPVRLVTALFEEIPEILRSVARAAGQRFLQLGRDSTQLAERIRPGLLNLMQPLEGFCYAITPGNDPRAAAIVAANLGCMGIPFILRPSIRDAAAPRVVQALLAAGFDPRFCSLVYLDRDDPLASEQHFRLVDACTIVWTFGPPPAIDPLIRFHGGIDHFEGKRVLRHSAGNCASVACGPFDEQTRAWLYASIGIAPVCTATRSVMAVGNPQWIDQAASFLASLKVGDPLDPETQVGFIDPRCLDYLESLVRKNSLDIQAYGGERLSPVQARPLLVSSQSPVPDFFAQEIPAYMLAVRHCADLGQAIEKLNASSGEIRRLAVSFFNPPMEQLGEALLRVRALEALVDKPTTTLLPALHEGNDYIRMLAQGKLIVL
jgi:acyl-CoA reductase-like NAD-dependent aldehyde dehydrogenase